MDIRCNRLAVAALGAIALMGSIGCTSDQAAPEASSPEPSSTATPAPLPEPELALERESLPEPTLLPEASAVPTAALPPVASAVPSGVTLIERVRLDQAEGFEDPSGLTYVPTTGTIWGVSDSVTSLFEFDVDGELIQAPNVDGLDKSLEAISVDPSTNRAVVVHEDRNEVMTINLRTMEEIDSRLLGKMSGYQAVADEIESGGSNKGLEGAAWLPNGDIAVLKEGGPGVLMRISADLETIFDHRVLTSTNGFSDNDTSESDLDFSGLHYDGERELFWIVSDRGRRLFIYDWATDAVVASIALGQVDKAEGVALDPSTNRLFVLSESSGELFIYQLTS